MDLGLLSTAWAFGTLCRFMEFEAAEEMQVQNTQLMNGSQGVPPEAPLKLHPPGTPAPEVCQQAGKAAQFQQKPWARSSKGGVQKPVTDQGRHCLCFYQFPSRQGHLMFQTGHT